MTLEDVKIEYRPLRVGFCIRDGNIEDLIKVAKWNSLLWGGELNPIIPIGDNTELADNLFQAFQVDILVPAVETPEIKAFMEKYNWARFPLMHHERSIFSQDSWDTKKRAVNILDVSEIFKKLWHREFRFSQPKDSNCILPTWASTDTDKNLFTLVFGDYPEENLSYDYKMGYKNSLRAKEIKIVKTKPLPSDIGGRITPISLTGQEMKMYGGRDLGSGVYIGDKNDFTDLLNYWNIRATGSYITFLPRTNTKRFIPFVNSFIKRIKPRGDTEKRSFVRVWFRGTSEQDYKKVESIIKPLVNKDRLFSFGAITDHYWDKNNIQPSYGILGEATTLASVNAQYGMPKISFQLTNKPILKPEERRFQRKLFGVCVTPSVGIDFSEYTTTLPVLPDLNEWYARTMIFDPFSLRVIKNIFGKTVSIITEVDSETIQITPIKKQEIIKKIFERASITAEKSGAGLIAERLIALMGGITGSSRIFKITGVRKFISLTNPLHQKTKDEILKIIDDNGSFKKFENEFGLKGGKLEIGQVFDVLLEQNLIQAGIEVNCPKCSIKNWVNMKDIGEFYVCEFCYQKSKFIECVSPIKVKGSKDSYIIDGTKWTYRLSGLLGRHDKQQGAIPVLLTLQHLSNKLHSGTYSNLYSTALELKYTEAGKEVTTETDLCVVDLSEMMGKKDIEILIGECKTANTITKAQIDRLVKIKEMIEKSGIRCHIVFVNTKKNFSSTEIGLFKKLYTKGITPILFTANELECWWDEYKNFKTTDGFKLPIEHPFTYADLAINSAYVYGLC